MLCHRQVKKFVKIMNIRMSIIMSQRVVPQLSDRLSLRAMLLVNPEGILVSCSKVM